MGMVKVGGGNEEHEKSTDGGAKKLTPCRKS